MKKKERDCQGRYDSLTRQTKIRYVGRALFPCETIPTRKREGDPWFSLSEAQETSLFEGANFSPIVNDKQAIVGAQSSLRMPPIHMAIWPVPSRPETGTKPIQAGLASLGGV